MDLQTLINSISTISFPDYESIQAIISPPDGFVERDPLKTQTTKGEKSTGIQHRINYLDTFLFCFFNRFNKDVPVQQFQLEFKEFKKVFLDELRNGAMRNWRISTNKRDKGVLLRNIEKGKLDKYTFQWIADFHDIAVYVDDREYIPRKIKDNKPVMKLSYKDDGYVLV